jgi:hypothetical protein
MVMSAAYVLHSIRERLCEFGVRLGLVLDKPFDLDNLIGTVQACAPIPTP